MRSCCRLIWRLPSRSQRAPQTALDAAVVTMEAEAAETAELPSHGRRHHHHHLPRLHHHKAAAVAAVHDCLHHHKAAAVAAATAAVAVAVVDGASFKGLSPGSQTQARSAMRLRRAR